MTAQLHIINHTKPEYRSLWTTSASPEALCGATFRSLMVGHDGYPVAWEHCVFCQRLDGALRLLGPYGYLAVCTICKGSGNHAQPHSASTLCSSCGGEGRWVKTSNMLTGKGGA